MGPIIGIQLVHDVHHVVFDGLVADVEPSANLLVAHPLSDQTQNLPMPIREAMALCMDQVVSYPDIPINGRHPWSMLGLPSPKPLHEA